MHYSHKFLGNRSEIDGQVMALQDSANLYNFIVYLLHNLVGHPISPSPLSILLLFLYPDELNRLLLSLLLLVLLSEPLHFISFGFISSHLIYPPSMKMHCNRRLLQNDTTSYSHTNESKEFLLSPTYTNTTSSIMMSPRDFNSHDVSTSMALSIVVIVTAIFFLGLFSLYIRYTSNQTLPQTPPPRRRHRRRRTSPTSSTNSSSSPTSTASSSSGVTAKSLPVVAYSETKQEEPLDCVVCLGEFQQGGNVKLIPRCGHMFHPDCIDTWLSCHASCPLCRSTQLIPLPPEKKKEISIRIVENADTSSEGERVGRTNSQRSRNTSVAVGERISLQRSMSL